MKETLNAIRVALFFLIGLAVIYVVYTTLSRKDFRGSNGYRVTALFNDMSTLSPEDDVRMAGVKIGKVEATELREGKGMAVLSIDKRYSEIPHDSVATISLGNLLGKNYVAIEYGNPASGFLKEGDSLQTRPTASVGAVLEQLNELGRKMNVAADSFSNIGEGPTNLFNKLDAVVEENRGKIATTLANIQQLSQDLRDGKGTLGKLIESDEAHVQLMAAVQEIQLAASDARKMFADVQDLMAKMQQGNGTLGKLLYDDELAQKIDATVSNLQAFSEKLNSGEGTLGKLVNDDELYRELRSMLSQAEQSLNSISDSGPVSAVGAAAGGLF